MKILLFFSHVDEDRKANLHAYKRITISRYNERGLCDVISDMLYLCRFKDHPTLNSRYLLLNLLGKGGFSEVYKVQY